MAPEQAQEDEPITLATDVWALGLLVFRMLSGKIYWSAADGSLQQLLRELLLDPLPPASQRCTQLGGVALPAGFDDWFGRCVVRSPALRFPHARQAWLALEPVLEGAGAQLSRRSQAPAPATEPGASPEARSGLRPGEAPSAPASTQLTSTAEVRAFVGRHAHGAASVPAPAHVPLSASAPVSLPAPDPRLKQKPLRLVAVAGLLACLAAGLAGALYLTRTKPTPVLPTAPASIAASDTPSPPVLPRLPREPAIVEPAPLPAPDPPPAPSASSSPAVVPPARKLRPGASVPPAKPKPKPSLPDLL
jgi:serine/threonine protein kinase